MTLASPIIRVENLGKSYRINHQSSGTGPRYRRLSEELLHYPKQLFSRVSQFATGRSNSSDTANCQLPTANTSSEDFWALKDVSFEVQPGEVVGIIGRNGAGKSTLLKVLSRITEPTTGRIELNGRVASLLEVGTGFHPELTGRENIFLNGAILGMTGEEVRKKFDEIVAFAEVERFLDTPVKRFSSGMYVRLAFAVAAHLDPEILVVDEVLAVGDAEFQKKCLGKMQDVAKGGRTVLFVSHNTTTIESLCTRGMLIEAGRVSVAGACDKVVAEYMRTAVEHSKNANDNGITQYIQSFAIKSRDGENRSFYRIGEDIVFEIEIEADYFIDNPRCGVAICSRNGDRIATLNTVIQQNSNWAFRGVKLIRAIWRGVPLNTGSYRVDVNLWSGSEELENLVNYKTLEVQPSDVYETGLLPDPSFQGFIVPDVEWETKLDEANE